MLMRRHDVRYGMEAAKKIFSRVKINDLGQVESMQDLGTCRTWDADAMDYDQGDRQCHT